MPASSEQGGHGCRQIRPVGERAVLLELAGSTEVLAVAELLRGARLPGVLEVVPAAVTVLISCARPADLVRVRSWIAELPERLEYAAGLGRHLRLDVVYDGDDLAAVAALTGRSVEQVIALHSSLSLRAAFGGFAPGFVYLQGSSPVLEVPRRDRPRARVPRGSVAVAGGYSAVYPQDSPGGWQLLGRTAAKLWDPVRGEALIRPGDTVSFRAVADTATLRSASSPAPAASSPSVASPPSRPGASAAGETRPGAGAAGARRPGASAVGEGQRSLRVLSPGLQSTLQDEGRPGHAASGVTGSGAMDRHAYRQVNQILGNPPGVSAVEVLMGALSVEAEADVVLAVTGAPVDLRISDGSWSFFAPHGRAFLLLRGQQLTLGRPEHGLRSYLGVRGGILADALLGSSATDTLSGLGPAPLAAGTFLARGAEPDGVIPVPSRQGPRVTVPDPQGTVTTLRMVPGPRDDWFSETERAAFAQREWTVSPQSDRIGLRFEGEALHRLPMGELPSEGTVAGSLQVPPDGLPVLFMADHPVTGGYPVIGTVLEEDLNRAAQLAPGSAVRFVPVDALMTEEVAAENPAASAAVAAPAGNFSHIGPAPEPTPGEMVLLAGRGLDVMDAVYALHDLGARAAVTYVDTDLNAPHVRLAETAYRVNSYELCEAELEALRRRSGARQVMYRSPATQRQHVVVSGRTGQLVLRMRIRAEDPARGFVASTGVLDSLKLPAGPWVRAYAGWERGAWVDGSDPELVQLDVTAGTVTQAIARAQRALAECSFGDLPTTLSWLSSNLAALVQGADAEALPRGVAQIHARTPPVQPQRDCLRVWVNGDPVDLTFPSGTFVALRI